MCLSGDFAKRYGLQQGNAKRHRSSAVGIGENRAGSSGTRIADIKMLKDDHQRAEPTIEGVVAPSRAFVRLKLAVSWHPCGGNRKTDRIAYVKNVL